MLGLASLLPSGMGPLAFFPQLHISFQRRNPKNENQTNRGSNGASFERQFQSSHDRAEALKSGQNALWGSQDGNRVRGKACGRGVTGFELALEDEGGEGELLFWEPPAPVTLHGTSSEGMSKALWDRGISKIFRSDYLTGRGKCGDRSEIGPILPV